MLRVHTAFSIGLVSLGAYFAHINSSSAVPLVVLVKKIRTIFGIYAYLSSGKAFTQQVVPRCVGVFVETDHFREQPVADIRMCGRSR